MSTDNHNLGAKLELRRVALRAWLSGGTGGKGRRGAAARASSLRVLDCFAGGQVIWTTLRTEFAVTDYLSFDLKPRRGRLKLDSLRFLSDQRWSHNVIDLDAYGSPWSHWAQVLRRGEACLVFLTIGKNKNGAATRLAHDALALAGIPKELPFGMHCGLLDTVNERCLGACFAHGLEPRRAWEAPNPGGNARYLAVWLEAFTTETRRARRPATEPGGNEVPSQAEKPAA